MGSHKFRGRRGNTSRSMTFAAENESVYGTIVKEMGKCSFLVDCSDSVRRLCTLRGKMQRRERVSVSDTVLVVHKESDPKKGYIDMKYTADEVKILRDGGYIREEAEEHKNIDVAFDDI